MEEKLIYVKNKDVTPVIPRSTIIASQFLIDTWHDIIGDSTLADAICDRVIHNAHKIILKPGEESMRKIHSTLTEGRTLL